MSFEQKRLELAEAAAKEIKDAEAQVAEGNIEAAEKLMAGVATKGVEIKKLELMGVEAKRLMGDFNVPTNDIPVSSGEVKQFNPGQDDKESRRDANYKPPLWVKGLPAAIQPEWVRKQMGSNMQAEADFYVRNWTEWFRSPSQEGFFQRAGSEAVRAMQEGTDTEGGFFVPEEYRTLVIHNVGVPGSVHRPRCTQVTTGLKDGYFPTIATVSWAAIAEEAAFGDNTPTIGQVSYTIRKSGGKVTIAVELLEDSQNNLPALLQQIFGEAAGRYEDQQLIEGDGSTEPEGLRTTGTDGPDTAANNAVVAQDILDWFWDLPAQFKANAAWSTRSDFMGLITGIGATADGIHMITDLTAAVPENLLGKPIMLADMTGWDNGAAAAADEELGAIGDFRNYIFVDRVGMSLKRDDSIYVNNDQVWFGARKRFDGRVALADAFRILKILS